MMTFFHQTLEKYSRVSSWIVIKLVFCFFFNYSESVDLHYNKIVYFNRLCIVL